ncbi:hypothetical protein NRS6186_14250 [Bacillus subtilis]|nr:MULTISPECIES: hypothetical protein [Bacillus]MED4874254.1 hypothetical protein [Bacillus subtilis]QGI18455.1 hypothetical protein GII81_14290 [Bacillus subtilis]CAF1903318.1 hypothetical protein NRS6186_04314 [Bacillus subtilis]CAI6290051.1 hypothetical protein NRS6186_14250 [Bacillus subtilis]
MMGKTDINVNCNNVYPSEQGVSFNIYQPCNGVKRVYFEEFSCPVGEYQIQIESYTSPPCVMFVIVEFKNGKVIERPINQTSGSFTLVAKEVKKVSIKCEGNYSGFCYGSGSVVKLFHFKCDDKPCDKHKHHDDCDWKHHDKHKHHDDCDWKHHDKHKHHDDCDWKHHDKHKHHDDCDWKHDDKHKHHDDCDWKHHDDCDKDKKSDKDFKRKLLLNLLTNLDINVDVDVFNKGKKDKKDRNDHKRHDDCNWKYHDDCDWKHHDDCDKDKKSDKDFKRKLLLNLLTNLDINVDVDVFNKGKKDKKDRK